MTISCHACACVWHSFPGSAFSLNTTLRQFNDIAGGLHLDSSRRVNGFWPRGCRRNGLPCRTDIALRSIPLRLSYRWNAGTATFEAIA